MPAEPALATTLPPAEASAYVSLANPNAANRDSTEETGKDSSVNQTLLSSDDERRAQESEIGFIRTKIVGIQHYHGLTNKKEKVVLVREPNNVYDRWAIRVDNTARQQVAVGKIVRIDLLLLTILSPKGWPRTKGGGLSNIAADRPRTHEGRR